ncbi:PREDICTED: uncharacterized protein LOC105453893 [Wasmannia auropunctata]|uniref:uncharacterized protein LOC105453893 n=1 Tax=Wasmannia auropunctata TaxID=64793 RepID=UPI0005EE48E8|nr:PREDICTED: uncharacterized protein LOC105453893 [Wasmannia auropunctata]
MHFSSGSTFIPRDINACQTGEDLWSRNTWADDLNWLIDPVAPQLLSSRFSQRTHISRNYLVYFLPCGLDKATYPSSCTMDCLSRNRSGSETEWTETTRLKIDFRPGDRIVTHLPRLFN